MQAVINFILDHLQLLAIVGGFIGTWLTIRRQTRVLQTYVALEFFRRYAAITRTMPDRLRFAKFAADPSPISDDEWRQITRFMMEYANLCSEEFSLRRHKRVPKDIWKLWEIGIHENFKDEIWRTAWTKVACEYARNEPFARFMNKLLKQAEQASAKN